MGWYASKPKRRDVDWLAKALADGPLRQCLDEARGASYIVDCDCRLKYWSAAIEQLTGYAAADMVDRWCRNAWPPRCNQHAQCFCGPDCPARQVMRDGQSVRLTKLTLTHADQSTSCVDVDITPLHDDRGSIVGALCTVSRHAA